VFFFHSRTFIFCIAGMIYDLNVFLSQHISSYWGFRWCYHIIRSILVYFECQILCAPLMFGRIFVLSF